jgi:hypothetical protein
MEYRKAVEVGLRVKVGEFYTAYILPKNMMAYRKGE